AFRFRLHVHVEVFRNFVALCICHFEVSFLKNEIQLPKKSPFPPESKKYSGACAPNEFRVSELQILTNAPATFNTIQLLYGKIRNCARGGQMEIPRIRLFAGTV
ncbi:MAG: hypothetical protein IJD43_10475, partial [Thermoguttaceae bacterium]|nr:hypothetical protein [Thermoguttaceae bacterium]